MADPQTTRRGILLGLLGAPAAVAAGYAASRYMSTCPVPATLGPEFTYDIEPFKNIDPALRLYRPLQRWSVPLQQPRGMVRAADGRILVAGDRSVITLDPQGRMVACARMDADVSAVALWNDHCLTALGDRVCLLDGSGRVQECWPSLGPDAWITSIAALEDGAWLADAGRRLVARVDKAGRTQSEIGRPDATQDYPGLVLPSRHLDVVAVPHDPDGSIWINNPGRHRVELHAAQGQMLASFGVMSMSIQGFCGCCNPTNLARLADGRLLTSEKGLPRVKVYRPDGVFQGVVAGPEAFSPNAQGLDLVTDTADHVYVLDRLAQAIVVFEPLAGTAT